MACADQSSSSVVFAGAVCSCVSSKYLYGMLSSAVFPVFTSSVVCTATHAVCTDIRVLLADTILIRTEEWTHTTITPAQL